MSEDYVHKDTFNAVMKGMRALMAASEARHEAMSQRQNAQIAEIRGEVKELRESAKGLEILVLVIADQFNNKENKRLSLPGFILTGAAVLIACVQVFAAVFRQGVICCEREKIF